MVVDICGGTIRIAATTIRTIWKVLTLVLFSIPLLLIFGSLLGFGILEYYDNSNEYLATAEQVYRCDVYPVVETYSDVFLRPLINLLKGLVQIWNFIGRLNRIFSGRALGMFVLEAPGLKELVLEFIEGVGSSLLALFEWLFKNPFTYHAPLYGIYKELIMDTVRMIAGIGCYLCNSLCSTFILVADILDSTELGCAIHHVVNGAYFTLVELVKMVVISFLRFLVLFMSGWDPYIPELEAPMNTLRVGVVHLGRAAGNIIRVVYCRIFGLISSLVETQCNGECHTFCMTACLVQTAVPFEQCTYYCLPNCTIPCRETYAINEYEECVDVLLVVDYLADLVGSVLHAAISLVWQFVWKFLSIIKDGDFGHLAEINLNIVFDSFSDPYEWYIDDGIWELTPYSRPTSIYIPQLVNATSTCEETYPQTEMSCSECRYVLMENDPDHLMSFDRALCKLGTDVDNWLNIPPELSVFSFLFCRVLGAVIRSFVSVFSVYWRFLQALASGGFSGAFLFIGYEPNFTNLYHDANYLADTIGMLIPVLSTVQEFYPIQFLIANPLRVIFVETVYTLYMLLSRIVNEIIRAIDSIDRTGEGYYYIDDFFCIGPHCISDRIEAMRDLLIAPPNPLSNGTNFCPGIPNKWDPDTNPDGIITFGEAATLIINFDEFLSIFGVEFELPDLACLIYNAWRVVITLLDMLLHVIFGWDSVGDYLYCTNTSNCAPIGPLICDLGRFLECPCTILGDRPEDGGFGLPCVCDFFEALGELGRRLGGFIWAIFRATGPPNNIDEIIQMWYAIGEMAPGSPLYKVATSISCLLKIFFPKVGDMYTDYCTSGANNHISETFRFLLMNVLRIISFALTFVGMIAETIINPTTESFRGLLEFLIRGAFNVLFGDPTSSDPIAVAGILGALGDFFACLLGPPGCIANCDNLEDNDNPCLTTFLNCAAVNLRLVSGYLVEVVLAIYDIFVGIFSGDGQMIGDGFMSLFVNIFDMIFAISDLVFDVVGGFVKGIMVAIFGEWIAGIVDAVMWFFEEIFEGVQWLLCVITFGLICASVGTNSPTESAALNSAMEFANKFNGKLGLLQGVKISTGSNGYYSFEDLKTAIRQNPDQFTKLFKPGLCQDTIHRIGVDRSYNPGVSDELFVRTCLGLMITGQAYEDLYGSEAVDHHMFYDPARMLTTLKQTMNVVGEYVYFKVEGPSYLEHWGERHGVDMSTAQSMKRNLRAGAESKCNSEFLDSDSLNDFECVLEMNHVDEPIAHVAGLSLFNRAKQHSMNVSRLWYNLARSSYENYAKTHPKNSKFGLKSRSDVLLGAAVDTAIKPMGELAKKVRNFQKTGEMRGIGYSAGHKFIETLLNWRPTVPDKSEAAKLKALRPGSTDPTKKHPHGFGDILRLALRGVLNVGRVSVGKAYNRTADAVSALVDKVKGLTNVKNQQAYQNRVNLKAALGTLHLNYPWLFGEKLLLDDSFTECSEEYGWCRDTKILEKYHREQALKSAAKPSQMKKCKDKTPAAHSLSYVNPLPPLNCLIVDETLDDMFRLIDEVIINPPNYTCGMDNEHWLHWIPVTNETVITITKDGFISWLLDWLFTVEVPYDFDLVETFIEFVFNFDTDPQAGYVGAYYYIRSVVYVPFLSRCSVESVARGTFGIGLWRALGIVLWVLFLVALVVLIVMMLTNNVTMSFILSLVPAIATAFIVGFFVVAFLAYSWGLPCLGEPTSLVTFFLGVPALPILPRCLPPDLGLAIDWLTEHPVIYVPDAFNVDPTKAYLQNCEEEAEFYHCEKFGFNSWVAGPRFWVAKTFPYAYTYFNYSVEKRWLVGGDTFDFTSTSPTEEQLYCEKIMYPITFPFIIVVILVIWLLVLVIVMIVTIVVACGQCCCSFASMIQPSPDDADPAVGTQM